ncbi:hypothetical protein S40285_09655 [Stachybotrys chlorohalonatus IBT 40285]|uniref:Uncharacterized protein n=1 Tax=Stachybotrys chlorohalonatus (strain IBT 40285) TaxID=1283841 RepID=A0A084R1T4_STAC4|nr:hypothetical protein S40285_09655 [Stachybotrys chlorohalonata IBT 40285]
MNMEWFEERSNT